MENNKTKNIIFSIVFLFSIAIPFPIFLFSNGGFNVKHIESIIEESPTVSIFNAVDKDFKDSYGLRKPYLQAHTQFKYNFLKTSTLPKKVVVGEEGWFYVGNRYSNSITETLKGSNFTMKQKNKILRKLNFNKAWLDSMGIFYLTCVAPSKLSVYPKYYYSKKNKGKSKFEDLRSFLSKKEWNLIDLKTKILQKKDSVRLYHKTDSHWNDEGAYLGYLTLIKELQVKYPKIIPVSLSRFKRLEVDSVYMDLTGMLGLKNIENRIVYKQINSEVIELKSRYEIRPGASCDDWEYELRYKNKNGLPFKVMIIRDSFSRALIKYLTETFEEVVLIWDRKINRSMVEEENPDILIQEIIERDIEVFIE